MKKVLFVLLLISSIFLFGCTQEFIKCGDGKCHSLNENATTCPQDCDPNYTPDNNQVNESCGDGVIDAGENCSNCSQDVVCETGFECNSGECVKIQDDVNDFECVTSNDCETNYNCINHECVLMEEDDNQNQEPSYNFVTEKVSSFKCDDPVVLKSLKVVLGNDISLSKRMNPVGHPANESFCSVKSDDGVVLYEFVFVKYEYDDFAFDSIQDEREQILSQWFDSIEHNISIGRESYLFEHSQAKGSFFRELFIDDEQPVLVNIRAVKETNLSEVTAVAEALVKVI